MAVRSGSEAGLGLVDDHLELRVAAVWALLRRGRRCEDSVVVADAHERVRHTLALLPHAALREAVGLQRGAGGLVPGRGTQRAEAGGQPHQRDAHNRGGLSGGLQRVTAVGKARDSEDACVRGVALHVHQGPVCCVVDASLMGGSTESWANGQGARQRRRLGGCCRLARPTRALGRVQQRCVPREGHRGPRGPPVTRDCTVPVSSSSRSTCTACAPTSGVSPSVLAGGRMRPISIPKTGAALATLSSPSAESVSAALHGLSVPREVAISEAGVSAAAAAAAAAPAAATAARARRGAGDMALARAGSLRAGAAQLVWTAGCHQRPGPRLRNGTPPSRCPRPRNAPQGGRFRPAPPAPATVQGREARQMGDSTRHAATLTAMGAAWQPLTRGGAVRRAPGPPAAGRARRLYHISVGCAFVSSLSEMAGSPRQRSRSPVRIGRVELRWGSTIM